MRYWFAVAFLLLALILGCSAHFAARTGKRISGAVQRLLLALIPPVLGNWMILMTESRGLALAGYYVYFLGMNFTVYFLLSFTFQYCMLSWTNLRLKSLIRFLLAADCVQLLMNLETGHAFTLEAIEVDGRIYQRLVPYLGQSIHRILCYGVFFATLIIFLIKIIRAPRIHVERYAVIFTALVVVGIWESYYIVSGMPIDRSMLGMGVCGLLVFYFSLYYRPMRLLDRMMSQAASRREEAVYFFDDMGRPIWANEPGLKMAHTSEGEYDGILEELSADFGRIYLGKGDWREQRTLVRDGEKRYFQLDKQTVMDEGSKMTGSFLIIRDRTEEHRILLREKYNATHDWLTGLYSRDYLFERIRGEIDAHQDTPYLVILTDVSSFKIINDIYGPAFGDQTLVEMGRLIARLAGTEGIYGRISADTFGLCLPRDAFRQAWAEKELRQFSVSDGRITKHVWIHLGIYEVRERDLEVSVMFDRARMALSHVKNDYNHQISWYNDQMRADTVWEQFISAELKRAIEERQIRPYLQPIVDTDGEPVGAEVLVRWIHPECGVLPPARFVPIFERNGMIAEVDRYMWRCAGEILARWKQEGADLFLSVNVSPKDFYFMDVVQELRDIVREYGIEPTRLRIEITETVMMTDAENRIRILNALRQDGFLIEMDDFGSGYSSLNMLKDMPIELIKIDMMFLQQTRDTEKTKTILRNILRLSEELGIISLTEGIENDNQYQMLAERGCDLFQGFYFSRPMPVEEYDAWRRSRAAQKHA